MRSLAKLSPFTWLCNHHHRPSPDPFHLHKLKLSLGNPSSTLHRAPRPEVGHSPFCLWPWLHVSEITPYLSFYVRLISHRIMSLSFLHVVACLRNENFFLRLSTIPLFVYTTFCWSLHPWTFELFPPLAVVKNAAVDISVQMTVGGPSRSSGHPHRSTVALSYGNSMCNFETT